MRQYAVLLLRGAPLLAPHKHEPRDVPRCGALSLLHKPLHYNGFQHNSCPRPNKEYWVTENVRHRPKHAATDLTPAGRRKNFSTVEACASAAAKLRPATRIRLRYIAERANLPL
jgi:hypothetical protein